MKDSSIVVGIDIGTSKVASIVAQVHDEKVNILGVSEIPSKGIRKGQIVDIEDVSGSINQALDVAERMAGYSIDRVFTSISGVHIESKNNKGIVAISQPEGEIVQMDVDRVLEVAGAVSVPSSKAIIHVLPKSFTVDGESNIKDPIGMTGVRLEVDTHIITANSTSVRNIDKVLQNEAGVGLNALVFSGFASSLAVLTETEKELGVVLVDIGAGITNICVFVESALCYSAVIPVGAKHITNDLAIGLRVSLESAEKIKLYLSKNYSKKEKLEKDESDEVDLSSLDLPEDLRKVSHKTLTEGIIRPRLNEIFTMVGIELKRSGYITQTPAGLVITGGGAKTVGSVESAKRMLSMPVRIGYPYGISGLTDDVEDPTFATAVGLIMFGKRFRIESSGGPLGDFMPSFNVKSAGNILGKIKKLLKSFLP